MLIVVWCFPFGVEVFLFSYSFSSEGFMSLAIFSSYRCSFNPCFRFESRHLPFNVVGTDRSGKVLFFVLILLSSTLNCTFLVLVPLLSCSLSSVLLLELWGLRIVTRWPSRTVETGRCGKILFLCSKLTLSLVWSHFLWKAPFSSCSVVVLELREPRDDEGKLLLGLCHMWSNWEKLRLRMHNRAGRTLWSWLPFAPCDVSERSGKFSREFLTCFSLCDVDISTVVFTSCRIIFAEFSSSFLPSFCGLKALLPFTYILPLIVGGISIIPLHFSHLFSSSTLRNLNCRQIFAGNETSKIPIYPIIRVNLNSVLSYYLLNPSAGSFRLYKLIFWETWFSPSRIFCCCCFFSVRLSDYKNHLDHFS